MNREFRVPVCDATVTVVWLLVSVIDVLGRHNTVVPVDHDVVVQSASAMAAVGVRSTDAKLRPLIVAVAPPLVGKLPLSTELTAGAENQPAAFSIEQAKQRKRLKEPQFVKTNRRT